MSYQEDRVMNFKHGRKLLETVDQHKAEIGTVAKNWEDHKTEAYAVGEYVIKDNVTYRFKAAHAANTAWNASEVEATNLGSEITGLKSAIGTVPTGKTVQGQIEALQTGKADMIVVTDSTPAAVMTFPDGADDQPMALKVAVEPVQDLHGYDNPWPAGGGRNRLNVDIEDKTAHGLTFKNDNGVITITGTCTSSPGTLYFGQSAYTQSKALTLRRFGTSTTTVRVRAELFNSDTLVYTTPDTWIYQSGSGDHIDYDFSEYEYDTIKINVIFSNGVTPNGTISFMLTPTSETVTAWEPYSNICPISGWMGANIVGYGANMLDYDSWKGTTITRGTAVWENDGVTLTATSNDCYTDPAVSIPVVPGEKVTLTWEANENNSGYCYIFQNNGSTRVKLQYVNNANAKKKTVKIESGVDNITFRIGVSDSGETIHYRNVRITFEGLESQGVKYSGLNVVPVSFPTSAGTVYGGTLTLNQDGTGTLVVDRGYHKITSNDSFGGFEAHTLANRSGVLVSDAKEVSSSERTDVICNLAKASHDVTGGNIKPGQCLLYYPYGDKTIFLISVPTTCTTSADANQWIIDNDVEFCYPLATPITYTLTHEQVKTLLGLNNVWADTGDILSVEYSVDTKLYVDQQISEKVSASQRLIELIVTANREDTMTATKAYSSGDLLIVNGTLYKASTSIANGATLTEGTNVTATTVAAEIAALA